ncbi:MAG: hypothetical protein ABI887_02045 [Burkholderiales bacterium]
MPASHQSQPITHDRGRGIHAFSWAYDGIHLLYLQDTYVLFPGEGHGFQRPANNIRFNAITEQFLSKFMGGRSEPLGPDEVEGNTAVLVEDSLR